MVLLLLIALFLSPQGINSSHSSKMSESTVLKMMAEKVDPAFKIVIIKGKTANLQQTNIMNIQLQPEDEQFIQTQIAKGKYENPEEVISKALKLLDKWEKGYQNWVEEICNI
jgi:putative addiction module CopG family antidote